MTTVVEEISSILKASGYVVNITPQEKQMMAAREIIILLNDIEIKVESEVSYIENVKLILRWQDTNIDTILSSIVTIMKKLEQGLTVSNLFRFEKPKIDLLGTAYIISLGFQYTIVMRTDI